MHPLSGPVEGGSIDTLRGFLNLSDSDWPLLLGWLVAAFRHTGPYPLLVLNGQQGSAKSTTARVLRELIDPNQADLRSTPQTEQDLMIAATNAWVVAFDNLSYIKQGISDALCRLSTGGGFSTRKLYENDEETIFDAQRPVILNGIEELAKRSDLLDRSIVLSLPVISEAQRKSEGDFWAAFEEQRPAILGALLGAVSYALAHVEEVNFQEQPRMADFARWVTAAEPALGLTDGDFMAAYAVNRGDANAIALESSPIGRALMEFMDTDYRRVKGWRGTAMQLLEDLRMSDLVPDVSQPAHYPDWPQNPRKLSGMLRRIAPNLYAMGLQVTFGKANTKKRERLITLRWVKDRPDPPASEAVDTSPAVGIFGSAPRTIPEQDR